MKLPTPPSPSSSNTLPPLTPATQPTQIPTFHAHQLVKSSGFFSPRGGNSFVILFDQYRYLKQPKKICDGDGIYRYFFQGFIYAQLLFFVRLCLVASTARIISSSSDKCNPKLLKNSSSCNRMLPSTKCNVLFTFSVRRKQK